MRVFVTGAAGYIGRATITELQSHGHTVVGLARSEANIEKLKELGAEPHKGSLEDLESLKSGARAADGVIHLAFIHDFNNFMESVKADRNAISAIGEVLAGTNKPFVIASGTMLVVKDGKIATEDSPVDNTPPFSLRNGAETLIQELSREKQICGSVVRLPPTVHSKEDKGILPSVAKMNSFVAYVGDGANRWPTVHRADAAAVFRLALEKGTPGAIYHAVAEGTIPFKDIANAIGKKLNLPVESKDRNGIVEAMGFIGNLVAADNPISSEKTQRELGWKPTQVGLLQDLEQNYFEGGSVAAKYA